MVDSSRRWTNGFNKSGGIDKSSAECIFPFIMTASLYLYLNARTLNHTFITNFIHEHETKRHIHTPNPLLAPRVTQTPMHISRMTVAELKTTFSIQLCQKMSLLHRTAVVRIQVTNISNLMCCRF